MDRPDDYIYLHIFHNLSLSERKIDCSMRYSEQFHIYLNYMFRRSHERPTKLEGGKLAFIGQILFFKTKQHSYTVLSICSLIIYGYFGLHEQSGVVSTDCWTSEPKIFTFSTLEEKWAYPCTEQWIMVKAMCLFCLINI